MHTKYKNNTRSDPEKGCEGWLGVCFVGGQKMHPKERVEHEQSSNYEFPKL